MSWLVSKLANLVVGGASAPQDSPDKVEADKENRVESNQIVAPGSLKVSTSAKKPDVASPVATTADPATRLDFCSPVKSGSTPKSPERGSSSVAQDAPSSHAPSSDAPDPGAKSIKNEMLEELDDIIARELEEVDEEIVQAELTGQLLEEVPGSLFMVNAKGDQELKAESVFLQLIDCSAYIFELRIMDKKRNPPSPLFTQPVSSSMQILFEKRADAICWMSFHGVPRQWRFQMGDGNPEAGVGASFKLRIAQALVETSRKEDFAKVISSAERGWVQDALDDAEEEDSDTDKEPEREEFEFEPTLHNESPSKLERGVKGFVNNNLNVGMASNRTFVFRGDHLGVYKHNEEDQMEYVTQVDNIQAPDKRSIAPTTTMLHQRDTKMLMLDPSRNDTVAVLDLETGKVVDEWQPQAEFRVRNLAPHFKYSQRTNDQVFAGVSGNGVFLVDPRQGGKNKMAQNFFYKDAPKFSCLATNQEGHVVVGSETGDLRLFSTVNQKTGELTRAKTKLPGLGDGVSGIDVTADGRWILATTKHYLLVIATSLIDDKNSRTGFQVQMPMAKRSKPIKLQLKYQDLMSFNIGEVNFTPATFNTGEGTNEEWIVTSTGPYIITWNFRKVQQGIRDQYQIKRTSSNVVQSKFRYNKEDQVVVNLPNDVYMEKRSKNVNSKSPQKSK